MSLHQSATRKGKKNRSQQQVSRCWTNSLPHGRGLAGRDEMSKPPCREPPGIDDASSLRGVKRAVSADSVQTQPQPPGPARLAMVSAGARDRENSERDVMSRPELPIAAVPVPGSRSFVHIPVAPAAPAAALPSTERAGGKTGAKPSADSNRAVHKRRTPSHPVLLGGQE